MRRLVLILLPCLLLPSCRDDRVPLVYPISPGLRLEHRLRLEAQITRSLQGQTRQQEVVATFRAGQEILEALPDGGAQADVSLVPESLTVDGRTVDPGPAQSFSMQLDAEGRVTSIAEAGAQPNDPLGPVGLERLLPRLRPVLPGYPVRPGDRWLSRTEISDETGTFSLRAASRLTRLGLLDGQEAALVRTTYESPVDRREQLANALADMRGTDVGAQEAWFSLDGFLLRSTGDSVGSYRVQFTAPGTDVGLAPVEGTLLVRLHTEMRLLPSG